MVAINLNTFGGMVPAQDERLLPDHMAAIAQNVWLYAGVLQGIRQLKSIHTCTSSAVKKVFRIPIGSPTREYISNSYWLEFTTQDVDVLKGPTANDSYSRYYWTSAATGPQYNTLARIAAGSTPYTLGVPSPQNFPNVVPNGGSSTVTVSRAYLYTWVTAYGEEGAPSAAYAVTGKQDDTWSITIIPPTDAEKAGRNLSKVRIYRTVTSSAGVATYFLVDEVVNTTTVYSDTKTDAVVSGNAQLSSTSWTAPPSDLTGMTAMPNGMIVGFRANEVWYCEPYRPHAWPALYTQTVDTTIVGIGVVGQTAIVLTQTGAYAATGINPSVVSMAKISTREACLSRASIISTPAGVIYASSNGLALATPSGVTNATAPLFTKDKWLDLMTISTMRSALLTTGAYYFFGQNNTGASTGGVIDPSDQRSGFIQLTTSNSIDNVFNDPWTNEVFVMYGGGVYQLELSSARPRSQYTWRSKKFQGTMKKSLSALKVYFDVPNEAVGNLGTLNIYADGNLVSTRPLTNSGDLVRLPSGFKADFWQIEIVSQVIVVNIQLATSARELANV
jgi:hypothetical protein